MVSGDEYENVRENMKAEATETRSEDRSTASREQRISDMNNEELCKWIKQMGAPEKTLIEMRSSKIEGAELVSVRRLPEMIKSFAKK